MVTDKTAVMWIGVSDGISTQSVFDLAASMLEIQNDAGYDVIVQDDEITISFNYKNDDEMLLKTGLKWGRVEQTLSPMCNYVNISIGCRP